MVTHIAYHKADFDGICAAAVALRKYPDAQLIPINYGEKFPIDDIQIDDTIIMVDFGLQPFSLMVELDSRCGELIWIDHHDTAIAAYHEARLELDLEWDLNGLRDQECAGCELTWRYLFPYESMPKAVRLLGRYDVWDHEDAEVIPFQYGCRSIKDLTDPRSPTWQDMLDENPNGIAVLQSYLEIGEITYARTRTEYEKYAKACSFSATVGGKRAIVANRAMANSQLFDAVWDPEKYDLMALFAFRKGMWRVSLYTTKDDVHCGNIAKALGAMYGGTGGGHAKAAGFSARQIPFPLPMEPD